MNMIKYIILFVIILFLLLWPFIKRLSRKRRQSKIIREALYNQRIRNQENLRRLEQEIRARQRIEDDRAFQELRRRRDEFRARHDPTHSAYVHPDHRIQKPEPKLEPIEFLKKEDFQL